jgi:hypothetical protein
MKLSKILAAGFLGAAMSFFAVPSPARAADHGDAPNVDNDSGADIADVFAFLDPKDNTKVCILGTFHGFIVPGEAANFAAFDPNVLYRFAIENTGDAKPDEFIDLTFSERTAAGVPQTATIKLPNKKTFFAPTTPSTLAATANPQNVTTDPVTGVSFFGGETDDPFFFDLVGFNRFVASVKAGAPDATTLSRGRDTFAGYNVVTIALDIPKALLTGKKNATKIGVEFMTLRRTQTLNKSGVVRSSGAYHQVDRMGNPAVNVALIPFALKNAYNAASPIDDAKGKFAAEIVATLKVFGTDQTHINALAGVAITTGDYLHLDLTIPNTGAGGGDVTGAGFPNGRRPKDNTIDIILTIINNGSPLSQGVVANDVPLNDTFPFLALPQQPRAAGVVDDNTRN